MNENKTASSIVAGAMEKIAKTVVVNVPKRKMKFIPGTKVNTMVKEVKGIGKLKKGALASGLVGAGALGLAGANKLNKKKKEKVASDIVNEAMEKVAVEIKMKQPNYNDALKRAGAKIKTPKSPLENAAKNFKKNQVKGAAKKGGLIGAGAIGAGALGVAGVKAMQNRNNNLNKSAFDIVGESFEKEAGIAAGAMKLVGGLGKATKALPKSVSGVGKGIGMVANANNPVTKRLGTEHIRQGVSNIGKGLVLPGAAVGAVGAANKAIGSHKDNIEKAAFEMTLR